MRLAAISDVHGNLPALEAVLADIKRRGADLIVNLGDCVSGPLWPQETCDCLRALKIPTVRGNHDRAVAQGEPSLMGTSDRFAFDRLAQEQRHWLGGLPQVLEREPGLLLFHATPHDDLSYLLDDIVGERLVLASAVRITARRESFSSRIALCGHSHQPRTVRLPSGMLIVNPGSVGSPAYRVEHPAHLSETGSPHARYAMVTVRPDGAAIELMAVEYDWDGAAQRAADNGRPEWAHALRTGYAAD